MGLSRNELLMNALKDRLTPGQAALLWLIEMQANYVVGSPWDMAVAVREYGTAMDGMASVEAARARFFTEGTAEAREAYARTLQEEEDAGHRDVDEMFGEESCGGWTWDPPCGSCSWCGHAVVTYSLYDYWAEVRS